MKSIIKFIWENRTWLFSGIGVFILAYLYKSLKHLHTGKKSEMSEDDQAPMGRKIEQNNHEEVPNLYPIYRVDARPLSAKEIISIVKGAPLLQQSDIKSHYCGIRVRWVGKLVSMKPSEGKTVRILINCGEEFHDYSFSSFDVSRIDYPGLGLLKEGDRLEVEGTIEDIDLPIIKLKNARIAF